MNCKKYTKKNSLLIVTLWTKLKKKNSWPR